MFISCLAQWSHPVVRWESYNRIEARTLLYEQLRSLGINLCVSRLSPQDFRQTVELQSFSKNPIGIGEGGRITPLRFPKKSSVLLPPSWGDGSICPLEVLRGGSTYNDKAGSPSKTARRLLPETRCGRRAPSRSHSVSTCDSPKRQVNWMEAETTWLAQHHYLCHHSIEQRLL